MTSKANTCYLVLVQLEAIVVEITVFCFQMKIGEESFTGLLVPEKLV